MSIPTDPLTQKVDWNKEVHQAIDETIDSIAEAAKQSAKESADDCMNGKSSLESANTSSWWTW